MITSELITLTHALSAPPLLAYMRYRLSSPILSRGALYEGLHCYRGMVMLPTMARAVGPSGRT